MDRDFGSMTWKGKGIDWKLSPWVLALAVLTVLLRILNQTYGVESFDAINYMLAVRQYDISLNQPQPPGYVLYILVARLFNLAWSDTHTALLMVSAVTSGLAVVAIYLAAREIFNTSIAMITGLVCVTSSFFWYSGELAAPYSMDILFSATLGWLCYSYLKTGDERYSWLSAAVLGLAGTFRLQTMVLMGPMFLLVILLRSWRGIFTRPLLTLVIFTSLFIPFNMPDGSLRNYWRIFSLVLPPSSIHQTIWLALLKRFVANGINISHYVFDSIGEFALPCMFIGGWIVFRQKKILKHHRSLFMISWLIPTLLVYLFVWAGNKATILLAFPPLIILVGVGLDWMINRPGWKLVSKIYLAFLVIWQAVVFLLFPTLPFGPNYRHFDTLAGIRQQVTIYRTKLNEVTQLPAKGSVVIAKEFRFLQIFSPEYLTYSVPIWDPEDPETAYSVNQIQHGIMTYQYGVQATKLIPEDTQRMILFDLEKSGIPYDPSSMQQVGEGDSAIYVIQINASHRVRWSSAGLFLLQSSQ